MKNRIIYIYYFVSICITLSFSNILLETLNAHASDLQLGESKEIFITDSWIHVSLWKDATLHCSKVKCVFKTAEEKQKELLQFWNDHWKDCNEDRNDPIYSINYSMEKKRISDVIDKNDPTMEDLKSLFPYLGKCFDHIQPTFKVRTSILIENTINHE